MTGRMHAMGAFLFLLSFFAGSPVLADPDVTAARKVLADNQESLITVKVVSRNKAVFQGREMGAKELTSETGGVVLDPSGLTVVSLFGSNPMAILSMVNLPEGKDGAKANFESEFTDIKMILGDGTEMPGKVVLRDLDLDLLFIRPEKAGRTFRPISSQMPEEPRILDQVIVMGRLGTSMNREPFMDLAYVSSVVKKPRPCYLLGYSANGLAESAGVPVFTFSGKVLGILLIRKPGEERAEIESLMGGGGFSPAVVPIQDILEVSRQAQGEKKQAQGGKKKE